MREKARIAGALCLLVGSIWMVQGMGMLVGSPMTGQSFWGWSGLALALGGAGLLVWENRSSRSRKD